MPTRLSLISHSRRGEIVGTVEKRGQGVEFLPLGTRVLTLAGANGFGGYAQFALATASFAIPLPPGICSDVAATALIAGATAKIMLDHAANLQPGETIFIPAATGGVGSFAVQIARGKGAAQVIAGVRNQTKFRIARELGATAVVNYAEPGWWESVRSLTAGKGVDVALEASGQTKLSETIKATASFGKIIVYGAASGVSATLSPADINHLL